MAPTTRPRTRPSRKRPPAKKTSEDQSRYTDQEPPAGGWKSSSVNTEHCELYLALLQSGSLLPTSKPSFVFNSYPSLRVVPPEYFPKFKQNCVERFLRLQRAEPKKNPKKAKKNIVEGEDSDQDQFDDTHLLYPASPASSVEERPSRMADDNLDYAGFDDTPRDAPTSDEDLRPLAPLSTLNTRNQQVQLPTTVAVGKTY